MEQELYLLLEFQIILNKEVGNDNYIPVCRKCYLEKISKRNKKKRNCKRVKLIHCNSKNNEQ